MSANIIKRHGGFIIGLVYGVATVTAAIIAHNAADAAGYNPDLFKGVAGGFVLGLYVWSIYSKIRNWSPLVDATSTDRIHFDPPQPAIVKTSPYDGKELDVYAIETNPNGGFPFKVWVDDNSGKEHHPYYAAGIEFNVDDLETNSGEK